MTNKQLLEKLDRLGIREAVEDILAELEAAEEKFPEWPEDSIHASAIVAEEAGELIRAALQYEYQYGEFLAMEKEAVQTGAMAICWLKNAPNY